VFFVSWDFCAKDSSGTTFFRPLRNAPAQRISGAGALDGYKGHIEAPLKRLLPRGFYLRYGVKPGCGVVA
jgi:hypothetical protein